MQIKELLKECNIITNKGKINPKFRMILDNKPNVTALLIAQFSIRTDNDLKTVVRMIKDEELITQTCKMCNSPTKYDFHKGGFKQYCSKECSWKDPANVEKIKQTKKRRYGCENYNNVKKILESKYGE